MNLGAFGGSGSKKMYEDQDSMMFNNNISVNKELYHVIHKVPSGDGPYVRAKHAQVINTYKHLLSHISC